MSKVVSDFVSLTILNGVKTNFGNALLIKLLLITVAAPIGESFRHGEYLNTDSYKELNNIGVKQCAKRCYSEANCKSINFSKSRYSCAFNYYNSQEKQLLLDSEYIYGDRNHMAQYVTGSLDCPDGHVLLKLHDGSDYCYNINRSECSSRLMWHRNLDVTVSVSSTNAMCLLNSGSLDYGGANVAGSAWCPSSKNTPDEFIQFEFRVVTYVIHAVITQGRADYPQWITTYRVTSSDDAVTWTQIGGGFIPLGERYTKTFYGRNQIIVDNYDISDYTGNSDSNTLVTNKLPTVVKSKYLRIVLVSHNSYPSIRFDLIACRA